MGLFSFISKLFGSGSPTGKQPFNSAKVEHLQKTATELLGDITFIFRLVYERTTETSKCGIGDEVDLWMPEKSNEFVIVYRKDDEKGRGKQMGMLPEEYVKVFGNHYHNFFKYVARVISLDPCEIECTLIDRSVTIAEREEKKRIAATKNSIELSKPYRPNREEFKITVEPYRGRAKEFKSGAKLYLESKSLDEYMEYDPLKLIFCNMDGANVAEKWRVPSHVKNIIKAQLNGHDIDFTVIRKTPKSPGEYDVQVKYTLKK